MPVTASAPRQMPGDPSRAAAEFEYPPAEASL